MQSLHSMINELKLLETATTTCNGWDMLFALFSGKTWMLVFGIYKLALGYGVPRMYALSFLLDQLKLSGCTVR